MTRRFHHSCVFRTGLAALLLATAPPALGQAGPALNERPPCPIGNWDGGRMEVAAGLQLLPDGRFSYGLSYGARDERAEGTWEEQADGIVLTSDPFIPPRFALLSEEPQDAPVLRVDLSLPDGISRQYFEVIVAFADGRSRIRQFSEDGLVLPLEAGDKPVALTALLPVMGLQSERFALTGSAATVKLRFDPNELGKVEFARTPLVGSGGDLLLERDALEIRFRRAGGGCEAKYP